MHSGRRNALILKTIIFFLEIVYIFFPWLQIGDFYEKLVMLKSGDYDGLYPSWYTECQKII